MVLWKFLQKKLKEGLKINNIMLILFNKNKLLKLNHREERMGSNDWIYFPLYQFMIWEGNFTKKDTNYLYMQRYNELYKEYQIYSKPVVSFSKKYLGFGEDKHFKFSNTFPKIPVKDILYLKACKVLKSSLNSYIQDKEGRLTIFRVEYKCGYDDYSLDIFDLAEYRQVHLEKDFEEKLKRDYSFYYTNITSYVQSRIEEILEEKEIDPLVIIIS